jgi:formamidopyrimidine-DNA glycosylase
VAGFRRLAARHLNHLDGVDVVDRSIVRNTRPEHLESALRNQHVLRVARRGKWLVIDAQDASLLAHFGMTGSLVLAPADAPLDRYERAVLHSDADLRVRDRRRLAGLWLATDASDIDEIIGPQGPDAVRLTARQLTAALHGRRGRIKAALMDQRVVAGLGNMLSDEVLWAARLHPGRDIRALTPRQVSCLHEAIHSLVARAARVGAIPRTPGWLASQRDAAVPACPRCHCALERSSIGGRTSIWCPHCQPRC